MEFRINDITKVSSFTPGYKIYRINDSIYDEIVYDTNMFYIIRRCGTKAYKENHGYDTYVTDKITLVYPLASSEIYEEYFTYEDIPHTSPEISVISIMGGIVHTETVNIALTPQYKEYMSLAHGSTITLDTSGLNTSHTSYVYKIKNNAPHELLRGKFENGVQSIPNVTINGSSSQSGTPSIDDPSEFKHVGEYNGVDYRISVGRAVKIPDLNTTANMWYMAQYNTRNYTDLKSMKKMTPAATGYIDDAMLQTTSELATIVGDFPLTSYYTMYLKAYVWVDSARIIQFGQYTGSCTVCCWVNGRRVASGGYWNGNNPLSIQFQKGRNLIELATYRDLSSGGGVFLKGYVGGVYTEGAAVSTWDNIQFVTYHNKWLKNVITKDNEDFYFKSSVPLRSMESTHDTYAYTPSGSTVTQNVKQVTITDTTGFQTESATNVYSIPAPSDISASTLTFNFEDYFEEQTYYQSNGTDYFNTGILADTDDVEIGMTFTPTMTLESGKALMGSCNSSNGEWLAAYLYNTNQPYYYFGSSARVRSDTLSLNNEYSLALRANGSTWTTTLNGATATGAFTGTVQNSTNSPILFLSYSYTPADRVPNGVQVKTAYIKKDGVVIQTLVPVKRVTDNQLGMYDKARNIFYYGQGLSVDYSQGNIDVWANKMTGVKYHKLGAEVMDSIAYYNNRLYFYTTHTAAELQAAIEDGLDIMYATTTPTTVTITNDVDTLNNNYIHTEAVNILPNADNMVSWTKENVRVTTTKNSDESVTVNYTTETSSPYGIWKDFATTVGQTYTISIEAKDSFYLRLCNGGSLTTVANFASGRKQQDYGTYTYTWTSTRATYRLYCATTYDAKATYRNAIITQNGYVPTYSVTDGNGESASATIDYSLSYTYAHNLIPVEVEAGKSYTVTRPSSGETWQLRYLTVDKTVLSYSSYLATTDTTATVVVPANAYYLEILDGANVATSTGYSVQLIDAEHSGTVITTAVYNNGTESTTLTLPHALSPGDELVYDENYHEWLYYPLSLDTDYETYAATTFAPITITTESQVSISAPASLTVALCKKAARDLQRPILASLSDAQDTGDGFGTFEWEEVIGADEYKVYVGNELVVTIDNEIDAGSFTYNLPHEYEGTLEIKACNSLLNSELSYGFPLLTIPNTPTVKLLDSVYENNRYYVTVSFDVNSMLVDSYNASYSIDGAAAVIVNLDGNPDRVANLTRTFSFVTSNISTGIDIEIEATNETGTNNYMPTEEYKVYAGFTKWTYKTTLRQVLLGWTDTVPNESSYLLKYSIDNGDWLIAQTDPVPGTGTQKLEYLSLATTSSMRVCLAPIIGGQRQIFTKPITVSKDTDTTLVPPANFAGVKIRNGLLQFSWTDTYGISDTYYELFYRYSDGTTRTITVPHLAEGGSTYSYRINTDTYGFATAKVRMLWELGESEYSTELTIYDLPDAETPPDIYHQTRTSANKIRFTWETYQFVRDYTLSLSIGGTQQSITCYDPEYELAVPSGTSTEIYASVCATNIGGEQTAFSDQLHFWVCNSDNREAQTIYVHAEDPKNLYTTIVGNGLTTEYYLYTLSKNSYTSYYQLVEKSIKTYLESYYRFEDNYWGHEVGSSGPLVTWISNQCESSYLLNQKTLYQVDDAYTLHYTIYAACTTEYKFYSEFVKMIIACFGDSITAGHPNYWAETGTGDETSQYEYWLSRRLKEEYDVVNKGYGQEKTDDMLERFDRDIASLGAHYCIILGGTNDWYQDASTHDLATGYTVMDGAIDNIKQIVYKCWDNDIYAIVGTLTPRNDITEDGKKLWDYFNDWVKDWTTEQSALGNKCAYVDFFNAGKDLDPPIPLEDPDIPYHLNPECDGDNVYDESGALIRSGLGVHMSITGYKVMGYSIPLTLFASSSSGFKLYKDEDCQTEEYLNTEEASNQFYEVSIKNARRGKEKEVLRYIKNIGNYPCLYYLYITNAHNMDYWFIDPTDGKRKKYLVGSCSAGMVKKLNIIIEPNFDDYDSSFEIRMIARELTSQELDTE